MSLRYMPSCQTKTGTVMSMLLFLHFLPRLIFRYILEYLHTCRTNYFSFPSFLSFSDELLSSVEGNVTYSSSDTVVGWTDSRGLSCADYAGLPDAREGACLPGGPCGCGFTGNREFIGDGSSGVTADDACCACRRDCGGNYAVRYTPRRSGHYTLAVMQGRLLEVQNITADVSARNGYFTLQYGPCIRGVVCSKTVRLAWNINGPQMQEALQAIPGVGSVQVEISFILDFLKFDDPHTCNNTILDPSPSPSF